MNQEFGVLPDFELEELIGTGLVASECPLTSCQVQPASIDLRLGKVAYRVRASFLAGSGRTVLERLKQYSMHVIDLGEGAVLERGCVYVVPLLEHLALPGEIHGVANAKSSTGRLDVLTRLITDGGNEFDRIDAGYRGPLYAEICPLSFSILVRSGSRLNQVRLRRGNARLTDKDLAALNTEIKVVSGNAQIDDGFGFSVDLARADLPVGFRARPNAGKIDVDKLNEYDPSDFWDDIFASSWTIILDPGSFYILESQESVSIPPGHAAEMAPYLAMVGEFRVHYAGFFDPGFGYENGISDGSRAVLEVRCHEAPFLLEHGQLVGRLNFERMAGVPERQYGTSRGSSYQGQGLRLSKHFRQTSS